MRSNDQFRMRYVLYTVPLLGEPGTATERCPYGVCGLQSRVRVRVILGFL